MYGQRQIFSCLAIVALLTLLNFYKSAIRRDKEQRHYAALNRREREAREAQQLLRERHVSFMGRWLEFEDRCSDVHALVLRPETFGRTLAEGRMNATTETTTERRSADIKSADGNRNRVAAEAIIISSSEEASATPAATNRDEAVRSGDRSRAKTVTNVSTTAESKAGIVYVAVFILLVSLGKAAYDLSKQFKEAQQSRTLSEDEMLRRCSLQEYSLIKHRQKKQQQLQQQQFATSVPANGGKAAPASSSSTPLSAALEPFLKKCAGHAMRTMQHQRSLDSGAEQTRQQHRDFVRRISTNPQDYSNGSGVPTEPGTPVKAGKLLAGRPAPLLRRCSVPVFMHSPPGSMRRPSMDAFSEDDMSVGQPETNRRRVRMIHRH